MSYIRTLLGACVVVLLAFFCLGIYIQPVFGDLTRLGYFSERDFGWTSPQSPISDDVDSHAARTPVIVIGDSFSARGAWQSVVAVDSELSLHTFTWWDIRDSFVCVAERISSLKRRYPETRFVILETIERSFRMRFDARETDCSHPLNLDIRAPTLPAFRPIGLMNPLPDPVYALVAMINTPYDLDRPKFSGRSVLMPLSRGGLFSNRRSELLLFLEEDISIKSKWSLDAIRDAAANAKALQEWAERDGMTVMVLIVPDKSTVYSKYFETSLPEFNPPDVWRELENQGVNEVNLKEIFTAALPDTVDLYLPNDTHVGNGGYVLMGKAVSSFLADVSHSLCKSRQAATSDGQSVCRGL
jgi:hypothetical protein